MDKEVELVKVQVFADYCHTNFTFRSSIVVSGFVGLLLVDLALAYQTLISWLAFYVVTAFIAIVFAITLAKTFRDYHANLAQIQVFFNKLEKNEPLPTLKEMRKATK